MEIPTIHVRQAAERLRGIVERTPLAPFPGRLPGRPPIELRLKLECLQVTGSFKARGAWNQISQLDERGRRAGVTATSSGNHGRALAWAAERAGVPCTIFMPSDAYPNKIAACRDHGAEVVVGEDRKGAERLCREAVRAGKLLIHPYAAWRTMEGAGTVGLEIAEDWPEVEVVVIPVGGGGLIAGASLALRELLGAELCVLGAEPAGAPTMQRGLAAGEPVDVDPITTAVQGLCPLNAGAPNITVCERTVDSVVTLDDDAIFRAQERLVNEGGWTVEPAGAAATAAVLEGLLPEALLEGRDASDPLRVAAVVSGGNPAPEQLAEIRARS